MYSTTYRERETIKKFTKAFYIAGMQVARSFWEKWLFTFCFFTLYHVCH